MLADHLDAALAAGEDMLAAGRPAALPAHEQAPGASLRRTVELVRALELALITRVLKAREWSKTLNAADPQFRSLHQLFQSGTLMLVASLAEFADATDADFNTGDGITAYFRSRGLIDPEAPSLDAGLALTVTETFLVTGRIELGSLLNLIAAYLDALEDQFILFQAPQTRTPSSPQAADASHSASAASA